jgi:hypothetical protein
MLALDLRQRITERGQKQVVGGDHRAVEVELDHRLGAADRRQLAAVFHGAQLLRRDVDGELDHLHRLAGFIEDRIVGTLDPDVPAALADPFEFAGLERAAAELCPEFAIFLAVAGGRRDEQTVVLAPDLRQRVAHGVEKILVGRDDRAVDVEFDDSLRLVNRR